MTNNYTIDPVKPYMRPTQNFALGGAIDDGTPDGTDGSDDQQDVSAIPTRPAGPGGDTPDTNPFPTKNGGFGRRSEGGQGDIETALGVVDQALEFGRNSNGLGGQQSADNSNSPRPIGPMPSRQGDQPIPKFDPRDFLPGGKGTKTSAVDADQDTQSLDAGGRVQAFDDGGDVEDQSVDQNATGEPPDQQAVPEPGSDWTTRNNMIPPINPGNMQRGAQRIINYLRGGDAATPQQVDQIAKQVDPDGHMDENERNLAVVRAASEQGGPEAAYKVVQANRVAFNAKQAFARAALNGVEGKPPDVMAATKAATQAFPHMLDGTSVEFAPSQTGVTVAVKKIGQGQPFQKTDLSLPQFNDLLNMGKDGMYDNLIENGIGPVLQQLKGKPGTPVQGPAAAGSANRPFGIPGADQAGAQPAQQPYVQPSRDAQGARILKSNPGQKQAPTYLDMSGGAQETPQQQPARTAQENKDIDPEITRRAARLFPNVSQTAQRNAWVQNQIEGGQKRGGELAVAQAQQTGRIEAARQTGAARVEASKNYAGGRVQAAEVQAGWRNEQSRQSYINALVRAGGAVLAKKIGNVPFGTELSAEDSAAASAIINRAAGAGSPAPAPNAPATPTAPTQGKRPPPGWVKAQ